MITVKVKEAAVYRSGSYVRRHGNIELKKGSQTIIIEGLTPTLDPSTVSVALPESVKGSGVNVERYTLEKQNEMKKDLMRKLQVVQNKIAILNDQIGIMKNNTDFSQKEAISVKEMSEYIDALPEKLETVYEQIRELQDEETELKKQLKEKEEQLQSYYVRVEMETENDGVYPVQLRYFERNASWHPLYEIHTEEDDKLSIRLKAKIRQNTIEDWEDVSLSLFTGNPSVSADIPELSPQRLSFYEPRIRMAKAGRNAAMGMAVGKSTVMEDTMVMEDMEAPMMAMEEAMYDVEEEQAETIQNDTMTQYDLNGTYTLEKGIDTSADLTSHQIGCRYHVIAVPKLDSFGYLAAEVRTADIEELIDSSAIIYHKGTYLGEIYLDPDQTKENYDISLGKDESIRLKRDQKKKYTSNVLLKGAKKTEFVYEIQAASLKSEPFAITLIDQIPVSLDKSITVDKDELSSGKYNEDNGEVKWDFTLEPGEKKNITLAYSISWPKDKKIYL